MLAYEWFSWRHKITEVLKERVCGFFYIYIEREIQVIYNNDYHKTSKNTSKN